MSKGNRIFIVIAASKYRYYEWAHQVLIKPRTQGQCLWLGLHKSNQTIYAMLTTNSNSVIVVQNNLLEYIYIYGSVIQHITLEICALRQRIELTTLNIRTFGVVTYTPFTSSDSDLL